MVLKEDFNGLNQAITCLLRDIVAHIGELDAPILEESLPPDREHGSKAWVFHSPEKKRWKIG